MSTKSGPGTEMSTVSCPCGASMDVDLRQPPEELICPECGQVLEILVSTDPRTKRKRLGILVKAGSLAQREKKAKAGGEGKTEEVHTAKCTCGAQITIVPKSADTIFICSSCEAEYTATLKPGRAGAESTLVLRPVLAMPVAEKPAPPKPAPKPAAKAAAPPKPPAKPATKTPKSAPSPKSSGGPPPSANVVAKENLLLMTKGDIGAQEILMDSVGPAIHCYCRKALRLKGEYHREILKCPDCGLAFRIFTAVHPKSGAQMAVMIPR